MDQKVMVSDLYSRILTWIKWATQEMIESKQGTPQELKAGVNKANKLHYSGKYCQLVLVECEEF